MHVRFAWTVLLATALCVAVAGMADDGTKKETGVDALTGFGAARFGTSIEEVRAVWPAMSAIADSVKLPSAAFSSTHLQRFLIKDHTPRRFGLAGRRRVSLLEGPIVGVRGVLQSHRHRRGLAVPGEDVRKAHHRYRRSADLARRRCDPAVDVVSRLVRRDQQCAIGRCACLVFQGFDGERGGRQRSRGADGCRCRGADTGGRSNSGSRSGGPLSE